MRDQKVIMKSLVGSRLWKTHTEDSDYDYRAITITHPRDKLFGATQKGVQSIDGSSDTTYIELDHFVRLLMKGNPTVLEAVTSPHRSSPDNFTFTWHEIYSLVDFDSAVSAAQGMGRSMLKDYERTDNPKSLVAGLKAFEALYVVMHQSWNYAWGEVSERFRDNMKGIDLEESESVLGWMVHSPRSWWSDVIDLPFSPRPERIELAKDIIFDAYMSFDDFQDVRNWTMDD